MSIKIPVSYGELLDKLSILEIKKNKISNNEKLLKINFELSALEKLSSKIKKKNPKNFTLFYEKLLSVNESLWNIEDEIRILEKNNDFSEEFISLARNVYMQNDKRFEIKNEINLFFKSDVVEQKQYIDYK